MPLLLYTWDSGPMTGVENMAWDEALLEWVRSSSQATQPPIWIVRTYQWQPATWSVGVHQTDASVAKAISICPLAPVVKRPTGGRAINHDGDQSFAIITNDARLWRLSLAQRYGLLNEWILQALRSCSFHPVVSAERDEGAYARSDQCFESHTPWDVTDEYGQKRLGCAQLVRKGGLLQHGALFWPSTISVQSSQWLAALTLAVAQGLQPWGSAQPRPLPVQEVNLLKQYTVAYQAGLEESQRLQQAVGQSNCYVL
ncbi:MAG: hypothetical protein U0003_05600 [Vampirovibrionales bacterium]